MSLDRTNLRARPSKGGMAIVYGLSRAGDYTDLQAGMDVLVALSNRPQVNNPANGYNPTPIRVAVRAPGD